MSVEQAKHKMKLRSFLINPVKWDRLGEIAKGKGLTRSDVLRRLIDDYILRHSSGTGRKYLERAKANERSDS